MMSFLSKIFNSRAELLRTYANQHGMYFLEKDLSDKIELLRNFDLFAKGVRARKVRSILMQYEELVDTEIYLFDYKGKESKKQTVFYVRSPKLSLPRFTMKPKGFFHKVKDLLIVDDVDFDNYPQFRANYIVQGNDISDIRFLFKKPLLEMFSLERKWSLEGMDNYLVFYQYDKIIDIEDLKTFYDKGLRICDIILNDESNEFV